jgi:hypothetical protein
MKTPEYVEGPKARKNFERGMIALFKVPKEAVTLRFAAECRRVALALDELLVPQ